ncbi:MAG: cyanophycinase [Planctomycetota bacterium]
MLGTKTPVALAGALLIAALGAASQLGAAPPASAPGAVIAVGGGGTPDVVPTHALELARARTSKPIDVVVIPHASRREDRGVASAEMWREAGADRVTILPDERDGAVRALQGAEVVWMGGGSQTRLLAHLREQGLVDAVRAAHQRGAVVGGTSAGAAVLGSVTIAGSPDPAPYVQGSMEREPGLGLVPDAIVDQHFAERQREGRLLTALLEGGAARGFGVSEGTGAVFSKNGFEVIGRSTVLVVDASEVEREKAEDGALMMGAGLRVDLVRTGAAWVAR